jgi:hypothetical protein
MAKINGSTPAVRSGVSPIKTAHVPDTVTHEGGAGFSRSEKSELFLLGVNYLAAGEKTYYDSAGAREQRFEELVSSVACSDPEWTYEFLKWLRGTGNIRTASVMGAAIAVHARLNNMNPVPENYESAGWNRKIVDAVCQRADEPGEFLAYWTMKYGRTIPMAVKRGLGDAVNRLYNEYSLMKYDTASHNWRFGDILNMTHARPKEKAALFSYAVNSRFGNELSLSGLPMIQANKEFRSAVASGNTNVLTSPSKIAQAGMTWEDVMSLAGSKVSKNKIWEAMIPSMGYMAILRNLRNFDEAGISEPMVKYVCDYLSDEQKVAKSRQFPFRFLSAEKELNSVHYLPALEIALQHSVSNIPVLQGDMDIYVDTSGSMQSTLSDKSKLALHEAAGLFGIALAVRNAGNVRLFGYADTVFEHPIRKGSSVLRVMKEFYARNGEVGWGTETVNSVRTTVNPNAKRVFIFTDGQANRDRYGSVIDVIPGNAWLYGFTLGGYSASMMPSGWGRAHEIGGLSDATFNLINLIERAHEARWPWEN